ncbi:P-loop containing nucleoside triphosphate hydrolase protein [Wilcoxina mikolae CBS 423.85]|nr:P-loop containing nucleoside triphosphate hydrolase protein [Wilcoxina mikolae CBS 423.85]
MGAKGKGKGKAPREMKHMKMHQALTNVSRTARIVARERIQPMDSFNDFKLLPSVREAITAEALAGLATVVPTAVQKLVIPALLGQESGRGGRGSTVAGRAKLQSYLIAAETGSGKTLAYTIPLLDSIKRHELDEVEAARQAEMLKPNPPTGDGLDIPVVEKSELNGKPRAIILTPTSELVNQVGELVKSFSHVVKLRTAIISRDFSARVIKNRLFGASVDVVVCTPHLLNSLTEVNPALFSRCTHIVADEADSLFDRTFSPITMALITRCENLQKLILCSATIPRSLDARLRKLYPDMKRLVTPNLHVVPRRIQLQVVDSDDELYRGNKNLACADTLYTIAKDGTEAGFMKKVIVFVNERETATELAQYLRTKGIDAIDFTRDSSDRAQAEILELFTREKQEVGGDSVGRQRMKVLVTTDITSRGVDTKTVKNVILYDKPHSAIDMIHRIGRTGRMGRRGRAVILVDKHTNKGWIKDIKTAMHMGGPLI